MNLFEKLLRSDNFTIKVFAVWCREDILISVDAVLKRDRCIKVVDTNLFERVEHLLHGRQGARLKRSEGILRHWTTKETDKTGECFCELTVLNEILLVFDSLFGIHVFEVLVFNRLPEWVAILISR